MRILLAVDGSDNSYEAVRALAHFARAEEVMLLHVLDVPKPAYPKMVPEVANEIYAAVEQAMRVEGECLLDRIASLLPMNIGPVTIRMEIGSPAEVIANVAQERKTDLLVMGARGLGPVQERLFRKRLSSNCHPRPLRHLYRYRSDGITATDIAAPSGAVRCRSRRPVSVAHTIS